MLAWCVWKERDGTATAVAVAVTVTIAVTRVTVFGLRTEFGGSAESARITLTEVELSLRVLATIVATATAATAATAATTAATAATAATAHLLKFEVIIS